MYQFYRKKQTKRKRIKKDKTIPENILNTIDINRENELALNLQKEFDSSLKELNYKQSELEGAKEKFNY